jgi:hypothetical protein
MLMSVCTESRDGLQAGVTLGTIARYQFGHRSAIQAVATDSRAWVTGVSLVLMTAVARNYDQSHFTESGLWLFGSLVFSFFSGTFLYFVLWTLFLRRHKAADAEPGAANQWWAFMGLFWLTAPIAWLYAFPVERMFDSYRATQANIVLLATVALWRVLLMSRVIAVLQEVRFVRALAWVAVPACIEVVLVVFVGAIFSPSFGRRVMASMGGMRNSPEESLLLSTLSTAGGAAFWGLIGLAILLALLRFKGVTRPLPKQTPGRFPWISLLVLGAFWIVLAVPPQREQLRFLKHFAMIQGGKYREAVDYIAKLGREALPPGRRLEPNPYEHRAYDQLPGMIAVLQSSDPKWIRDMYLDYASRLFDHYSLRLEATNAAAMFEGMSRLPEGRGWVAQNRTKLHKLRFDRTAANADELAQRQAIVALLTSMGANAKDLELDVAAK